MGYTMNTCVSRINVPTCKVDYMIEDTFMYAVVTLNYKKVMHIIPTRYRVVTMVVH